MVPEIFSPVASHPLETSTMVRSASMTPAVPVADMRMVFVVVVVVTDGFGFPSLPEFPLFESEFEPTVGHIPFAASWRVSLRTSASEARFAIRPVAVARPITAAARMAITMDKMRTIDLRGLGSS